MCFAPNTEMVTNGIYWEAGLFLRNPFLEGCDGVHYQTLPPGRWNMLYFQTHFVQFSWFDIPVLATHDARGCLVWTLLGIILFLRSLYSKFTCWGKNTSRIQCYHISSMVHRLWFIWSKKKKKTQVKNPPESTAQNKRNVVHFGSFCRPPQ